MTIVEADFDHFEVVDLLRYHVRQAHENSPPGTAFALDLDALKDPAVTLWAAWSGMPGKGALMGLGALRRLAARHGEVKSMRTAPGFGRQGVAKAMLAHITAVALARGYTRLSLETGANDAFAAARALYEAAGFRPCAPFGDYELTEFNRYYTKAL